MSKFKAKIGDVVQFTTRNSRDSHVYRGQVIGMTKHDIARLHGDISSYNEEVRKVHPEVGSYTTLDYFLVSLDEGYVPSGAPRIRAFATDWVEPGDLNILDETKSITLKIYDMPDNVVDDLIAQVQAQGFVVEKK